jgi:hypothetical protein
LVERLRACSRHRFGAGRDYFEGSWYDGSYPDAPDAGLIGVQILSITDLTGREIEWQQ